MRSHSTLKQVQGKGVTTTTSRSVTVATERHQSGTSALGVYVEKAITGGLFVTNQDIHRYGATSHEWEGFVPTKRVT